MAFFFEDAMKLKHVHDTRQSFAFATQDPVRLNMFNGFLPGNDSVYFDSAKGLLLFPKAPELVNKSLMHKERKVSESFKTVEACEQWIENYKSFTDNRESEYDPDESRVKTFENIKSMAVPQEEVELDWNLIKKFFNRKKGYEAEDIRSYAPLAANNIVDRQNERFPIDILNAFKKTYPGKSLLIAHAWGPPGVGIIYKAEVIELALKEAKKVVTPHPMKKLQAHLEEIQEIDGGLFFLKLYYYIRASDTDMVERLDMGIWGKVSVGFRAPAIVPNKAEDEEFPRWWEYQNSKTHNAEGLELSIVWLGTEFGAGDTKSVRKDDEKYGDGKTPPPASSNDNNNSHLDTGSKSMKMTLGFKGLSFERTFDTDDSTQVGEVQKDVDGKIKVLTDESEGRKKALDNLQAVLPEGSNLNPDSLQTIVGKATKADSELLSAKKVLVDETIKFMQIGKQLGNEEEEVTTETKALSDMPVSQLLDRRKLAFETARKSAPTISIMGDTQAKDEGGEPKNKSLKNAPNHKHCGMYA